MIRLQFLGGVDVAGNAPAPDAALPRRRVLALLALVARAAPSPIGREKLLGLLWPESTSERARASLRQAVFSLRRDLGEEIFLPESAGGLQLDASHVTVDLWEFSEALARQSPADAVAAYRGPFLEGFSIRGLNEFSAWAEAEREKLERQYLQALDTLSAQAEQAGRYDEAVAWRRKQAAADPLSSRITLALLKALVAAGDRVGALKHAGAYELQIRQQLDTNPDPIVSDFVDSLRAEGRAAEPRRSMPTPARAIATPSVAESAPFEEDAAPAAANGRWRRQSVVWIVTGAVTIAAAAAASRWQSRDSAAAAAVAPPVIVLGSGLKSVSGRDPNNKLIACTGPACPAGPLPQDAFVVPKNSAYTQPTAQTEYIAPVVDGSTPPPPGYKCCTTAVFESVFTLPRDAIAAAMTISVLADNRATIEVNGRELGRQSDGPANFVDGATFSVPFIPDKTGKNRLQVTLWDGGGALGLHYIATVTYRLSEAKLLTPALTRQ